MLGFGERLVNARKRMGYSQRQLAELLDITPTRLNYWEKNKREPDFFMFSKIIKILEVDANEMLGLEKKINEIPHYNSLNTLGKAKADEYIEDLADNPKYTEHKPNKSTAVFHTNSTDDNSAPLALQITTAKN
ncbi:helix-turn-helix transcriptional regulator [Lachnospiraceae bacterium MD329]|nr:helix-turn-helix transcriptional regulator [Lachnospiraceae bacterium MD329]